MINLMLSLERIISARLRFLKQSTYGKSAMTGNANIGDLPVTEKTIKFQKGYGIESTFVAEPEKFAKILIHYYQIDANQINRVQNIILTLNQQYNDKVQTTTDEVNREFESHYRRQKEKRLEKIYNEFDFRDLLSEITTSNIQNIMTKKIMDGYLSDLHNSIRQAYPITKPKLNSRTIFDAYYDSISCLDDILDCHLELIRCLV